MLKIRNNKELNNEQKNAKYKELGISPKAKKVKNKVSWFRVSSWCWKSFSWIKIKR
ncbi:hypothetical protein ONA24_07475 [Mycoplasmopsis cynos]|uniref:hypothetical protein n=1 Tax=Mycoplasmopsis cynos TaxID=171284 RepID=UPI0024CDA5EF|nr:hypothetical protein [Mycoplasmopsis cynos]WAM09748.1 hypothetical protein ONA24_07475 [Mycoplasmopsis cynos]